MNEKLTTPAPQTRDTADMGRVRKAAPMLNYASTSRAAGGWYSWTGPCRRATFALLFGVALFGTIEAGVDWGRGWQTCADCGARRSYKHLRFFGLGMDYGERIASNSVSRFLEAHDRTPCRHRWWHGSSTGGALMFRYRACGPGGGPAVMTNHIASIPHVANAFERRAMHDPDFADQLREAIHGTIEEYWPLLEELRADSAAPTSVN